MSEEASTPVSFWQSVRQALRGEEHDYTALPLNRAVILLAVPMVLEMIMESLFAVVDVYWVSNLGKEAVAVVGITDSLMTLVYAVAIGISIAATAIVSRRIGEKEPELASQAAGQIVLLGLLVSSGIGILLGYLAPDILRLIGTEEKIVTLGSNFARIMLGGNATVFLIFLLNAIFRGAGDAVIAMRTLWLANALNIVLGPCFIFGWGIFPELGVTGAAVATNIGRGIGVTYQLWHLAGHHSRVKVRWQHFRPVSEVIEAVLRKSGSGIVQLLISTTSWLGLYMILNKFGSSVIAGYTIAIRIVIFALMPAWGLANAGSTLVGQNLGAGKPERAEAAVWIAVKFDAIVLSVIGLSFVLCAHPLIRLFTLDPEVMAYGTQALWIVSLAFPLYAGGMCFEAAFNGSGDTWTPARLNFLCLWLGQIPIAWVLAKSFGFGPVGAFIAVPVAYSLLAIFSWLLFKRGHWKTQKV